MNKSILKKMFIALILVGTLAIILNIYLILNNYTIRNVIKSNNEVVLSELAHKQLDDIYKINPSLEIPVCLLGKLEDNNFHISSIKEAEIIESTKHNVTYVSCESYLIENGQHVKVIGSLHNHPNNKCYLSTQDMKTYAWSIVRGQGLIGLYCNNKYMFYTLAELEVK
ncbi:MAG: hypothetical protein KKD01_19555 [Proteobacteria bacterium]|nr:hypothetical protein [Pseudomonadota bacterium]